MATDASTVVSSRQLVVDTDFGFDDILSLLLLDRSSNYKMELISTVSGVSVASRGATYARAIFGSAVDVAAGRDVDSHLEASSHQWLPSYRNRLDEYMASRYDVTTEVQGEQQESIFGKCTATALKNVLEGSVNRGCDLLCLGPLTNVASWLEDPNLAQLMRDKIETVWILGGTENRNNDAGEFNFQLDCEAVRSVTQTPHLEGKLRIVTADVSGPDSPNFAAGLEKAIGKMADEAHVDDMIYDLLRKEPRAIYFDPLCAFACTKSDQLQYREAHIRSLEPTGNILLHPEDYSGDDVGEHRSDRQQRSPVPMVRLLEHLDDTHQDQFIKWISEKEGKSHTYT